jgi:hypothetical protein
MKEKCILGFWGGRAAILFYIMKEKIFSKNKNVRFWEKIEVLTR